MKQNIYFKHLLNVDLIYGITLLHNTDTASVHIQASSYQDVEKLSVLH